MHKGGLSGTVLTTETVTRASLETKGSGVEQNISTISQRELAVAKIFALLFIIGNFTIICSFSGGMDDPLTGTGNDDWIKQSREQVCPTCECQTSWQ